MRLDSTFFVSEPRQNSEKCVKKWRQRVQAIEKIFTFAFRQNNKHTLITRHYDIFAVLYVLPILLRERSGSAMLKREYDTLYN